VRESSRRQGSPPRIASCTRRSRASFDDTRAAAIGEPNARAPVFRRIDGRSDFILEKRLSVTAAPSEPASRRAEAQSDHEG
jgi:hypothetical protein